MNKLLRTPITYWGGSRFCADETIEQYIQGFSKREKLYSGADLRVDSVERFVADLVRHEILTIVEEGKK